LLYNTFDKSYWAAERFVVQERIESTSNIEGSPVYILSGTEDEIIPTNIQELVQEFYEGYGAVVEFDL